MTQNCAADDTTNRRLSKLCSLRRNCRNRIDKVVNIRRKAGK